MAEVQTSGPLALQKFTMGLYQTHHRAETGIIGDIDGSAFGITLPPAGDTAEIGSATIDSIAKVGGFPLVIPAGTTQSIEIPPSLAGGTTGRTDLIVARCDIDGFNTAPGPVRLDRIEGTDGSLDVPAYDPFDLPLYSVRRRQDQALNQAIATPRRWWSGRSPIVLEDGSPMPASAPLGSRVRRGVQEFVRQLIAGVPTWVDQQANLGLYQTYVPTFNTTNITLKSARWVRLGNLIRVEISLIIHSMGSGTFRCSLPVNGRAHEGWTKPMGRAVARRGPASGANLSTTGDVVNIGDGTITAVTVVSPNGQWGSNTPISWNDGDGTDVGLTIEYEAAP